MTAASRHFDLTPTKIESWVEDGKRGMANALGTGGPAVTAGSMLLLYEVALALFIGLGPLFILCLLFDQTKQLFQKWLFYGIGTMFSMAVLAAMISIALDMVIRVSAAFWTSALVDKYLLDPEGSVDMTSQALQQGGMGLILTTLILTAPPNGGDVLPGHVGWLQCILADRWQRRPSGPRPKWAAARELCAGADD